jgi:hypothetical protein
VIDDLFEGVCYTKGAANHCLPPIAVGAPALDNAAPASPQPDATRGAGAAVTAEPAVGVSRPSNGTRGPYGAGHEEACGLHMDSWAKTRMELVSRSVEDLCPVYNRRCIT